MPAQDAAIFMFTKLSRCRRATRASSITELVGACHRDREGERLPITSPRRAQPCPQLARRRAASEGPGVGFCAHPCARPSTVLSNTSVSSPFGAMQLHAGTRVAPVRAAFAPNFGRSLSSVGSRCGRGPARGCAESRQIAAESRQQRPRPTRPRQAMSPLRNYARMPAISRFGSRARRRDQLRGSPNFDALLLNIEPIVEYHPLDGRANMIVKDVHRTGNTEQLRYDNSYR